MLPRLVADMMSCNNAPKAAATWYWDLVRNDSTPPSGPPSLPRSVEFEGERLETKQPPPWLASVLFFALASVSFGGAYRYALPPALLALALLGGIGFSFATLLMLPLMSGPSPRWRVELPDGKLTVAVGLDGVRLAEVFLPYSEIKWAELDPKRYTGLPGIVRITLQQGQTIRLLMIHHHRAFLQAFEERKSLHDTLRAPREVRKSDGYRGVRVQQVVPELADVVAEAEWADDNIEAAFAEAMVSRD